MAFTSVLTHLQLMSFTHSIFDALCKSSVPLLLLPQQIVMHSSCDQIWLRPPCERPPSTYQILEHTSHGKLNPRCVVFSSSHIAALLAWSDTLQTINFIREAFPVLYIPGPFRTSRFPHHPDNLDFELCDGLHRRHLLHSCYSG